MPHKHTRRWHWEGGRWSAPLRVKPKTGPKQYSPGSYDYLGVAASIVSDPATRAALLAASKETDGNR
jgi:hypothetical protein